jgi:hypothetical protein
MIWGRGDFDAGMKERRTDVVGRNIKRLEAHGEVRRSWWLTGECGRYWDSFLTQVEQAVATQIMKNRITPSMKLW